MDFQPLKREFRIVKSPDLTSAKRGGATPPDERQRDVRPGRFTVSGSFVRLPEGGLPDEADLDADGEWTGDWRRV